MSAGHDHQTPHPASRRVRRLLGITLIPYTLATVVGLVLLWPTEHPRIRSGIGFDQQLVNGAVSRVEKTPCVKEETEQPSDATAAGLGQLATDCARLSVRLTAGPDAGKNITLVASLAPGSPRFTDNDGVVLSYEPSAPADLRYQIVDFQRGPPLALLALVFAVVVIVLGRWRGLAALAALAISFVILAMFMLPAILAGSSPLLVAVVGSSAIMLVALYVTHGINAQTSIAVLGTLTSLLLIGVLGAVFLNLTHLTGLSSEETSFIGSVYQQVDVRGLLLAAMIIGSLGVLDDVTVTQTSAVWELKQANSSLGIRAIYRSALRIGRDHISSTVNTLVLAYAGASLPLLLLFSVANRSLTDVATREVVAVEIVRTLVGSIGLVASVPVTTALAALVASLERPAKASVSAANSPPPDEDCRGKHRRRAKVKSLRQ